MTQDDEDGSSQASNSQGLCNKVRPTIRANTPLPITELLTASKHVTNPLFFVSTLCARPHLLPGTPSSATQHKPPLAHHHPCAFISRNTAESWPALCTSRPLRSAMSKAAGRGCW